MKSHIVAGPFHYGGMSITVEAIDVSVATEYLKSNTANFRKVSNTTLTKYKAVMNKGKWNDLNGDTIVFDENGVLLDGQHRLLAIIQSGIIIKVIVIRGVKPRVIDSLDEGRKRKAPDLLARRGVKNVTIVAGAIRAYEALFISRCPSRLDNGGLEPTEVAELYDKMPAIAESVKYVVGAPDGLPKGVLAALFFRLSQKGHMPLVIRASEAFTDMDGLKGRFNLFKKAYKQFLELYTQASGVQRSYFRTSFRASILVNMFNAINLDLRSYDAWDSNFENFPALFTEK